VQAAPAAAGIELANWNWKVVRQFIQERFGLVLGRSSCWNYLHRLGFVVKRPKKRLLKAKAEKRDAFVAAYAALRAAAQSSGAKIFFVDEAHFRADVELRAKWVLKGEPALVDTSSPRLGEKATYYWRRARWRGCRSWTTPTPRPRWLSCSSCVRSIPSR
jgi:hypothetical protein